MTSLKEERPSPHGHSAVAGAADKTCRGCVHFRNDPAYLEAAFAALSSLSSAYGSVRGDDGLCVWHGRFAAAHGTCSAFTACRPASATAN